MKFRLLLLLLIGVACEAFVSTSTLHSRLSFLGRSSGCRQSRSILLESSSEESPNEENKDVAPPVPEKLLPTAEAAIASYPINAPSPLLLATSIVLGIAATGKSTSLSLCCFVKGSLIMYNVAFTALPIGSSFELMGEKPPLGFAPTAAIAAIGFPACLYLFYAAVLKATAETEEDDAKFLGKK